MSASPAPLPVQWLLFNSITIRFFLIYDLLPQDREAVLAGLTGLLEHNRLTHAIATHFPLSEIVKAHEAVESGQAMGNVVVDI